MSPCPSSSHSSYVSEDSKKCLDRKGLPSNTAKDVSDSESTESNVKSLVAKTCSVSVYV